MSRAPVSPCPACARHVRLSERACPFCGVELPRAFREQTAPRTPAEHLNRAALYALRMGAISATAAACGGSIVITSSGGGAEGDAATSDDRSLGGGSSSGGASEDAPDPIPIPLYGGFNGNPPPPPPVDAAAADADRADGAAVDAGVIHDAAAMNDVAEGYDAPFNGVLYGGFTGALYGGVCVPSATQCSGNGFQTCSTSGVWGPATPCVGQACVNGTCVGSCVPGSVRCSGGIVQTCDARGAWSVGGVACSNDGG